MAPSVWCSTVPPTSSSPRCSATGATSRASRPCCTSAARCPRARCSGSRGVAAHGLAPGWSAVLERIGTLDLNIDPASLTGDIDAVRLFAGYSGWGPGQLDWELEEESWFVVDAEPSDVLDTDPESLWKRVLQRQPDRLALLAHFPPDISVN